MNRLREILNQQARERKPSKYHSEKETVDGITFDSRKEARRYQELLMWQRSGEINNLERQVKFELIPAQKECGRVIERAVSYVADFVYYDTFSGLKIVEDVKSDATRTSEYRIKRKLMLWRYGIRIKEV